MKRIFNFFLMTLMLVAVASCGKNDAALKAQIESGKKHCPMSMGMAGKLSSMSYDEGSRTVQFDFTLNKDFADVAELKEQPEIARESMRLSLSKGDMKKLLKMMVDADASLAVVYKNKGSQDEFKLEFTDAELKEIYDKPMSEEESGKLLLLNQIKGEKKRMPYKIDTGLMVTDIQDSGDALVYVCEVDENEYEIADMEAGVDDLKATMKDMLKDRSMRGQVELLSLLGKGFEYKYVGKDTGKVILVTFTADEIAALAKKSK